MCFLLVTRDQSCLTHRTQVTTERNFEFQRWFGNLGWVLPSRHITSEIGCSQTFTPDVETPPSPWRWQESWWRGKVLQRHCRLLNLWKDINSIRGHRTGEDWMKRIYQSQTDSHRQMNADCKTGCYCVWHTKKGQNSVSGAMLFMHRTTLFFAIIV